DGDALTYAWDFGDGTTGTGVKPSHTYADNGSYTVTLTVTDAQGAASSPATTTASITNVAPAVNAGPNQNINPGSTYTLNATFGDGTTGTGVRPAHAYPDNGSYTVTLTVTDARGAASTPSSTTATIANAAPVVFTGANQTATTGSPFTLSATFSDPGGNDGPWAYSIDWGDGSAATLGSATSQTSPISATHTYAAPGTNTIRVTVTDKDGGAGSSQL